jgi:hypothetical protein
VVRGLLTPLTVRLSESVGQSELEGAADTYLVGDGRLVIALDIPVLVSPERIGRDSLVMA